MGYRFLFFFGLTLFLFACASKPGEGDLFLDSDIRPVEQIYNSGVDYLFERNYQYAIEEFKRVEAQYPYSSWVRHALLMAAFSHYLSNQYAEAIIFLDRFIALYSGNANIVYAYYLRAMCYYEQIGETQRDISTAVSAYQAFRQLIGFYPNSIYAIDARFKLDLVSASLASYQMHVGRWEMERDQFGSALNRFNSVIRQYNQSAFAAEALHRQVEIYLTLGLDQEAKRAASILGFNYPDSVWYKHSYRLLAQARLIKPPKRKRK